MMSLISCAVALISHRPALRWGSTCAGRGTLPVNRSGRADFRHALGGAVPLLGGRVVPIAFCRIVRRSLHSRPGLCRPMAFSRSAQSMWRPRGRIVNEQDPPRPMTSSTTSSAAGASTQPSSSSQPMSQIMEDTFQAAMYALRALGVLERLNRGPAMTADLITGLRTGPPLSDRQSDNFARLLRAARAQHVIHRRRSGAWTLAEADQRPALGSSSHPTAASALPVAAWTDMGRRIERAVSGPVSAPGRIGVFDWVDAVPPHAGSMLLTHLRQRSATAADLIVNRDMSCIEKVIDVGGQGTVLAALLTRHLRMKGLLLNPRLTAELRAQLDDDDLIIRWTAKERVDILRGVPKSYRPLFLLDTVICQLGDQEAIPLLHQMLTSMEGVGRAELWLIEPVLPYRLTRHYSLIADLWWMALTPHGRLRTLAQHHSLLKRAGWRDIRVQRLPDDQTLISAQLPLPP